MCPTRMVNHEEGVSDLQAAISDAEANGERVVQVVPLGQKWLLVTDKASQWETRDRPSTKAKAKTTPGPRAKK